MNSPENVKIPDGATVWGEYKVIRVGKIKINRKPATIFLDTDKQS